MPMTDEQRAVIESAKEFFIQVSAGAKAGAVSMESLLQQDQPPLVEAPFGWETLPEDLWPRLDWRSHPLDATIRLSRINAPIQAAVTVDCEIIKPDRGQKLLLGGHHYGLTVRNATEIDVGRNVLTAVEWDVEGFYDDREMPVHPDVDQLHSAGGGVYIRYGIKVRHPEQGMVNDGQVLFIRSSGSIEFWAYKIDAESMAGNPYMIATRITDGEFREVNLRDKPLNIRMTDRPGTESGFEGSKAPLFFDCDFEFRLYKWQGDENGRAVRMGPEAHREFYEKYVVGGNVGIA